MKSLILLTMLYFSPLFWRWAGGEAIAQNAKGFSVAKQEQQKAEGKTYALIVGISKYKDPEIPKLQFADKDALEFRNYLIASGVDSDNITLFLNQDATRMNILSKFLDLCSEQLKPDDRFYFYFSGHGDVESKVITKAGYLLSYDAPHVSYSINAIEVSKIQEYVATASGKGIQAIVITDACHSGKLAGGLDGLSNIQNVLQEKWTDEIKILSCGPGESSLEGNQWGGGRGLFSFELINGMAGMADRNKDGYVSLLELNLYLMQMVPNEAGTAIQNPVVTGKMTTNISNLNTTLLQSLSKQQSENNIAFNNVNGKGLHMIIGENDSLNKLLLKFNELLEAGKFVYQNYEMEYEDSMNSAFDVFLIISSFDTSKCQLEFLKNKLSNAIISQINSDLIDEANTPWFTGKSIEIYDRHKTAEALMFLMGKDQLNKLGLLSKYYYLKAQKIKIIGNSVYMNYDMQAIDSAIYYDQNAAYIYNIKALALMDTDSYNLAIISAKKAIVLSPKSTNAYQILSMCFLRLHKLDSSNYFLQRALLFNNDFDFKEYVYENLESNFSKMNMNDSSELYKTKLHDIQLEREFISYLKNAGISVEAINNFFSDSILLHSKEILKQTYEIEYHPTYAYLFACIYSLLDNKENAIQYLEIAIKNIKGLDYKTIEECTKFNNIRPSYEFKALMKKYFPTQYDEK